MKLKLLFTISLLSTFHGFSQFGSQQIISTATLKPYLSIPFDIDNDGYMDVLTASGETYKMSWYRNLDGMGNFGPEIIINEIPVYYISIDFVDIDTDGDMDILYHSNNASYIAWMENLDGAGNFGPEQIINEQDFISSVKALDMDNDGDQDLIAATTNTFTGWIVWYENEDGQGNFGPEITLFQNTSEFAKIALEDIDNDGLLDIIATEFVYAQGKIFWFKNMGNATFADAQVIYQFLWVQSGGTNISEFQFIDINNDGKKDIAMTSYDENFNFSIHWLENLDNLGNYGDLLFIMSTDDYYVFYDLDNDGDNDMLLWNLYTDIIAWKKNQDGLGTFGNLITISTEVDFSPYDGDAKAADFDGDGWLDIVSASSGNNKLVWYKNNTLGISKNEFANYKIYPNPTNGILYIESKLPISQISVFNLLGQLIETNQNTNQIDLSNAEAGVYLLNIEDEKGNSQTHKILKD